MVSAAPVGATVTITGQNLSGATTVEFNGTPSTISSDAATQIVTAVPTGATTGPITITVPAGTATSEGSFTVT
jgi:large repetitive protein